MKLRVSNDLILSADFVTSTQAILAQKGKGKSYAAAVEAEELLAAGQLVVIVDPTDAHFGLRSSPDGRSTGYPIAVFGGDHGDVQLEPGGGAVLAEAIVRERFSAIICTETMTKGEELRFIGDFLETLYRKNREALHLFIDEADLFAPQQPYGGEARTCGATDDIVRRGRKKGIGCTLITQRASVLNKNVLSQADMLVALGCSHPLDLDAIEKWVRKNADPKLAKTMMDSLPSLPRGDAWAWNPAQHLFKRITIRQRHTFDSGATPKAGEKKREPKILAPVDIARLGQSMAEAVQRQKENDPKHLKAEVARLKKANDELAAGAERAIKAQLGKAPAKIVEKTKIVDKPVLKDGQLARAEKILEIADRVLSVATARVEKTIEDVRGTFGSALARAEQSMDELRSAIKLASAPTPAPSNIKHLDKNTTLLVLKSEGSTSTPKTNGTYVPRPIGVPKHGSDHPHVQLTPAHLRILSAIAWWESIGVRCPDLGGVAFVAGTSAKSSAFDNNRSRLRAAGYIDYPEAGHVQLTARGVEAAPPPILPPTNEALHEAILQKVTPAHARMLRALIEAYPSEMSLEELARRAGTSATSSAFDNNRSWLRARGLSHYPRTGFVAATDLLFPETEGS